MPTILAFLLIFIIDVKLTDLYASMHGTRAAFWTHQAGLAVAEWPMSLFIHYQSPAGAREDCSRQGVSVCLAQPFSRCITHRTPALEPPENELSCPSSTLSLKLQVLACPHKAVSSKRLSRYRLERPGFGLRCLSAACMLCKRPQRRTTEAKLPVRSVAMRQSCDWCSSLWSLLQAALAEPKAA